MEHHNNNKEEGVGEEAEAPEEVAETAEAAAEITEEGSQPIRMEQQAEARADTKINRTHDHRPREEEGEGEEVAEAVRERIRASLMEVYAQAHDCKRVSRAREVKATQTLAE